MITIENAEFIRQGTKALLTFHVEDAPTALEQISQARLQKRPQDVQDWDPQMLVIEGDGPAGPLVVAFGPMKGTLVHEIHTQIRELTVCALGQREVAYAFLLEKSESSSAA